MGRLRKQLEKLQLRSSEGKAVMLEQQLAMAEESVRRLEREKQAAETRAEQAERRVSTIEGWRETNRSELRRELSTLLNQFSLYLIFPTFILQIADLQRRAEEAERRAKDAENTTTDLIRQTTDANQRMREAEARARESTQAVAQAEQRATRAEAGAHFLQQQNEEMAVRVRQAEQAARQAQERARMTEQRAQRLETRGHDQFWVVNREEIQLTDQELGKGGWAVVRVAKLRGLRVAAKCLHTLIVSDYNRQLFVREMSIAARVRHPNLVQFIGAMMEGEPIILTELMSTSLRALLERRPFNPAQITSISLDVARALNYLHLMHPDPIIHRDISSANVLLEAGPSNSWRAKVSDYGSANFLQQLRTAGPGNPTYAAPEADIPSQQSPKMDVYSYGVLLLEMCSQRFPNPEGCEALLQRVQQPTMVALIRQCMEQEPMRRPTMSDIIGQLE